MNELDRARIEKLTAEILAPIQANYVAGPISRERALEALNALAAASALVLAGCDGGDGEARAFLNQAIDRQISDLN